MSVTTTQNPIYYNTANALRDYHIHHSNADPSEGIDPSLNEHPTPSSENPADWPQDHRRVPDFRPVNHNVDMESRGGYGRNGAEATFVYLMLNGCRLNSVSDDAYSLNGPER